MERLFGTNGVRGVANVDLTVELAARLGRAVGSWLPAGALVLVARDARTSGPALEAATVAGLLSTGARVVRIGVVPTPAAQYFAKTHPDVAAGIVVTASHNPPEFNGLKLLVAGGFEATRNEEEAVEQRYFAQDFRAVAWNELAAPADDGSANERYLSDVRARVDAPRLEARHLQVVCDTGGGAGGLTSPALLRSLGCRVTALFEDLDGEFRGRRSEPTEDNLTLLKETVRQEGADVGIAHDGDADRCIFVDERGAWVSGDVSLALLARSELERHGGGVVCTPVSTSSLLEEVTRAAGGRVHWTAVGSPIVAQAMRRTGAVYGGEENGGIIFPEHQYCRDAALTAVKMLELLARESRPLSALAAELPRFHVTKLKFSVAPQRKPGLLGQLESWVVDEFPGARIDRTDGLKVFVDRGWILVRPSGTEPIFRVYAESKDEAWSQDAARRFVDRGRALAAN